MATCLFGVMQISPALYILPLVFLAVIILGVLALIAHLIR